MVLVASASITAIGVAAPKPRAKGPQTWLVCDTPCTWFVRILRRGQVVSTRSHSNQSLIFGAHIGIPVPMIIAMFLWVQLHLIYDMCNACLILCWQQDH